MRKTHPKEFKFKVALEAIKGDLTIGKLYRNTKWLKV